MTGDAADPLPSWNGTANKTAVLDFVKRVVTQGSSDYVAPAARIAVFDNDGTLWSEKPVYVQAYFIIDRVKELAPKHPEWKTTEPFSSILKGDLAGALSGGNESLLALAMATHAGMTTDEFEKIASQWMSNARHPTTGRPFTEMVYQPMLELLTHLRANGFKTYIVSGGGVDFMRPWTADVYGIPPEQVVGSLVRTKFEIRDGKPVVVRIPELAFLDDKEGKPVAIQQHIGQRPLIAVGNSDGDFQMLQWTTAGKGPRLGIIVHHTDAKREWAYDRDSHVGRLARGLDEGPKLGWKIIDMKRDWRVIHPPQASATPSKAK